MTKELNIGIVGLGTVGSGVIKSIEKNKDYFKNNYDVKFNIIGISANSKNKERSFDVDNYNWFDEPLELISEKKYWYNNRISGRWRWFGLWTCNKFP